MTIDELVKKLASLGACLDVQEEIFGHFLTVEEFIEVFPFDELVTKEARLTSLISQAISLARSKTNTTQRNTGRFSPASYGG